MNIKFICPLLIFLLAVGGTKAQPDEMFRGNAAHHKNYAVSEEGIFNKISWTFRTAAAIRSSAITINDMVCFGSNDGYLYALQKTTGRLLWKYHCGSPVSASPAYSAGLIYIVTAQQQLLALHAANGKLQWQKTIGLNKPYDWAFDYYYPSPVISNDTLLVASADGKILLLDKKKGSRIFETSLPHFIRATPALADGHIYIGDTNGDMYALNTGTGKQDWVYHTTGAALNNDTIGFDRKAILSSAIVENDALVFGGRDGFLYCLNRANGTLRWKFDHKISWVISSPSIINGQVITGTSDGHFIQSVNIKSGTEQWRVYGAAPVWSSPLVAGNYVYTGGNEGVLHCINIATGENMPHPLCINAKIFSSPVVNNNRLYFGADNGIFYCLEPQPLNNKVFKRYVYWDKAKGSLFLRNGIDMQVKDFFSRKGYTVIDREKLEALVNKYQDSGMGNLVVFVSSGLPRSFLSDTNNNLLHAFIGSGAIVADIGNISLLHDIDSTGNFNGFNFKRCRNILGINYMHNDLRSFGGIFSATATAKGTALGIKQHWTSTSPIDKTDADIVLGTDEKGRPAAWIKNIRKGRFVQLWVDQAFPEDYNFLDTVLENIERM